MLNHLRQASDEINRFIRTHGLLDGRAEIVAVVDTRAPTLVKAEVTAPSLEGRDEAALVILRNERVELTVGKAESHSSMQTHVCFYHNSDRTSLMS